MSVPPAPHRPGPALLDGVDLVESGSGETVLLVPGSYSTPAAWRPISALLPERWRLVSTSLRGYGGTAETRRPDDTGIEHEVDVVTQVVRAAGGGPVHLVGHSFGATVALAAALSGAVEVRSLALFEANPVDVLRVHGHGDLHEDVRAMSLRFEAAVAAAEPDAAAVVIDFYGGAGTFAAMPPPVQDHCRRTVASNVLDWRTDLGYVVDESALARLDVPVLVVRGALTNAAMHAVNDVLVAHLPRVRPEVVEGASHFLVSTHPAECAALLAAHLDDAG